MSNRDVTISKALSYVLRHGAEKHNVAIDERGYIKVSDLLALQTFKSKKTTLEDITRVVDTNAKKRFALEERDGHLYICATQGHLMARVDTGNLQPLDSTSLPEQIIHGTTQSALAKIRASGGLSRMGRNHVHCTDSVNLTSGFRASSNALIYIDGPRSLQEGIKWYRSANGVVLTPGNADGFVPCSCFCAVTDRAGAPL